MGTNACTDGQIFTQYSGISTHSMGACIAMIKTQSEASLCEDYFTMPFIVLDKSLHTSGNGSKEFDLLDGGEAALPSMDAMIHNVFSHEEPIVITSQSFESLFSTSK